MMIMIIIKHFRTIEKVTYANDGLSICMDMSRPLRPKGLISFGDSPAFLLFLSFASSRGGRVKSQRSRRGGEPKPLYHSYLPPAQPPKMLRLALLHRPLPREAGAVYFSVCINDIHMGRKIGVKSMTMTMMLMMTGDL